MKRVVLLSAEENGCTFTQIVITDLKAVEVAKAHVHENIQDGFYVLGRELVIVLDGETEHCQAEDSGWVPCGIKHELRVVIDVRVMTIECAI